MLPAIAADLLMLTLLLGLMRVLTMTLVKRDPEASYTKALAFIYA